VKVGTFLILGPASALIRASLFIFVLGLLSLSQAYSENLLNLNENIKLIELCNQDKDVAKDINFGEKALKYVENESRNDSNSLVHSDLKLRFRNAFNFGSYETIHRLESIKSGMEEHLTLINLLN
jgi:hypothetical protein